MANIFLKTRKAILNTSGYEECCGCAWMLQWQKLFTKPGTLQIQEFRLHIQASYPLYQYPAVFCHCQKTDQQPKTKPAYLITSSWPPSDWYFSFLPRYSTTGRTRSHVDELLIQQQLKGKCVLSYKSTLLVKKNEKTIYYQLPPTLKKLKMASSVITFLGFVPQSLFLFLLNVIWKKDVFKHFTATINMKLCSCEKSVA